MNDSKGAAAFWRTAAARLRGVKREEEWNVYAAVAFLCIAAALALAFGAVHYNAQPENKTVQGQNHIALPAVKVVVPKASAPAAVLPAAVSHAAKKTGGDWRYDEVRREWRCQ